MPTSLAMAATEVYVVANIVRMGGWHLPLVLAIGSGAGLGCLLAMWLHGRFVK